MSMVDCCYRMDYSLHSRNETKELCLSNVLLRFCRWTVKKYGMNDHRNTAYPWDSQQINIEQTQVTQIQLRSINTAPNHAGRKRGNPITPYERRRE